MHHSLNTLLDSLITNYIRFYYCTFSAFHSLCIVWDPFTENCFRSTYWPAHPDDPQWIRVASVIQFSVCLSVLSKFSNFWPPSRDCSACTIEFAVGVNLKTHYQTNYNECASEFAASVNLKTHDTFRETVRLYDILAHSTQ